MKTFSFVRLSSIPVTLDSFIIPNMEFDRRLIDDSLECLECLPLCSKTQYRVFSSEFPLSKKGLEESQSSLLWVYSEQKKISFEGFNFCLNYSPSISFRRNLSTFNDIATVHIYYALAESTLFTADVLMTWQEIVSKFGMNI